MKRLLLALLVMVGTSVPAFAQAPTIASTGYQQGYGSTTTINVTITNGFTAGNTVIVGIMQFSSTERSIVSMSDGVNSYTPVVSTSGTSTYSHAGIHAKTNIGAVAPGSVLTIELDNIQDGYVFVQEISPATVGAETGTAVDLAGAGATYLTSDPGVTTASGNVLLFAVGGLSGGSPNRVPTSGSWTSLIDGSSNDVQFFMYRRSSSAITSDTGSWQGDNARAYAGVIASFYSGGGGGGPEPQKGLLLMGVGGWQ